MTRLVFWPKVLGTLKAVHIFFQSFSQRVSACTIFLRHCAVLYTSFCLVGSDSFKCVYSRIYTF